MFVAEAERVWVTKHGAMILKRPRSKEEGAEGIDGGGGDGGGGGGAGGWDVVSEHAEYHSLAVPVLLLKHASALYY